MRPSSIGTMPPKWWVMIFRFGYLSMMPENTRRAANFPDYLSEKKSKYEIWWTFGWSYETAAAMARLVFSGIMDKYPNLKIITHHFGGIVPMLEGRIGPGWDQLGARTS